MASLLSCTITLFLCITVCSASFSWSNCGVQLDKGITYVGASIDPATVKVANSSLSINVKATTVSTIDGADTRLVVWKDGEEFLNVDIQDLCTIVSSSTSSLSCPIPAGPLSFTYTFSYIPAVVSGNYKIMIESSVGDKALGCLELSGYVSGLGDSSNCWQTSKFSVAIDGNRDFSEDYRYMQVGPYGNVNTTGSWGTFATNFVGTADVGGTVDTTNYRWGLYGSLRPSNAETKTYIYDGDFSVGYLTGTTLQTVFSGKYNWTVINPGTQTENSFGSFWLDPKYIASSLYTYPSALGNLGPFSISKLGDGSFLVTGEREWCTCGFDSCGVCNGDGSTCLVLISTQSEWSTYRKTAVGVGVSGGFIGLVAVVALFYVLIKTKDRNRRRHDDQDLIDTPEKPDYGTLAIDEVINESESGPVV